MEEIKSNRHIACYKCRYYQVTWDVHKPYGCRAHGFKTHRNPALIVYESSGMECQLFEMKDLESGSQESE